MAIDVLTILTIWENQTYDLARPSFIWSEDGSIFSCSWSTIVKRNWNMNLLLFDQWSWNVVKTNKFLSTWMKTISAGSPTQEQTHNVPYQTKTIPELNQKYQVMMKK
jgi:hypothetical protein